MYTGTQIFVPPDILSHPDVVAVAVRCRMTPAEQSQYTSVLIQACGGDISKVKNHFLYNFLVCLTASIDIP